MTTGESWASNGFVVHHRVSYFAIASAMVIYVSDLLWARVRFGPVPFSKLLTPRQQCLTVLSQAHRRSFHHCVSDVDTLWIPDCF